MSGLLHVPCVCSVLSVSSKIEVHAVSPGERLKSGLGCFFWGAALVEG